MNSLPCSFCGIQVLHSNFLVHAAYCERHIKSCPACELPILVNDFASHVAGHEKIECSSCLKQLEKGWSERHLLECPAREVGPSSFFSPKRDEDLESSHTFFETPDRNFKTLKSLPATRGVDDNKETRNFENKTFLSDLTDSSIGSCAKKRLPPILFGEGEENWREKVKKEAKRVNR